VWQSLYYQLSVLLFSIAIILLFLLLNFNTPVFNILAYSANNTTSLLCLTVDTRISGHWRQMSSMSIYFYLESKYIGFLLFFLLIIINIIIMLITVVKTFVRHKMAAHNLRGGVVVRTLDLWLSVVSSIPSHETFQLFLK